MPFSIEPADLVTIFLLIILEGLLSGDNALVLAVLVLPLKDPEQQARALRYGLIGAFVLRTVAILLATVLASATWVGLVGGLYLIYLAYKHFAERGKVEDPEEGAVEAAAEVRTLAARLGLSLFWVTVIKVEMTDLVFAVDSILVAVAMTKKTWVIITGGILGLVMMRLLTMQVLALIKRYPRLIDGAYVVVGWVGIKLIWEFLHKTVEINGTHPVPELPRSVAIGVVMALFAGAFYFAWRDAARHPAVEDPGAAGKVLEQATGGGGAASMASVASDPEVQRLEAEIEARAAAKLAKQENEEADEAAAAAPPRS